MRIPHLEMLLATSSLFAAAAAAAAAAALPDAGPAVQAAWVSKTVNFTYRGITTHYTCDGLQQKLRHMLTMLGARDVSVRGSACINAYAPEPFPTVNIRMQVLEPVASGASSATVLARWRWTDLLTRRNPTEASADCELLQEFNRSILPLFEPRSVDYRSTCVPRTVAPGTVRLRVEVLEPERRG